MSHFYSWIDTGTLVTSVTRRGFKDRGMRVVTQCQEFGVRVDIVNVKGKDIAYVHKTGGRDNPHDMTLLMAVTKDGFL